MYQTLYRKWRPLTFDDVCGQEHVSSILRYEVMEDKTSHAYLFCGSRGTGKTTCAKLLARAINCESPQNGNPCGVCPTCRGILSGAITDVVEMDAASNNGVDNIRDIRDEVAYAPAECKKRVFIIDEVHMLSTSAFNALLKTLEEPPAHIVFILATTEMHKIPATILSRCQRFDFRRITSPVIAARLRTIADAEHIAIDDEALYLIAKLSAGGMRDAIGMLELCSVSAIDGKALDAKAVAAICGVSPVETVAAVVDAIAKKEYDRIFAAVDAVYRDLGDIRIFWQSLISFYRDMLVTKTVREPAPFLDYTEQQLHLPIDTAKAFSLEMLLYHTQILDEVLLLLQKNTSGSRVTVEMALVRMCDASLDHSPKALLARISALEDQIALGIAPAPKALPKKETSAPDAEVPVNDVPMPTDIPPIPDEVPPAPITQEAPRVEIRKSPKRVPDAPKVQAPPQADAVPAARKVLHAFRRWQDAVKKLEATDPSVVAFLRDCKAYTCEEDGKLYLHAPDSFSLMLLQKQLNAAALANAVNLLAQGKTYTETDIVMESKQAAKTSGYEMIDELVTAAEELDGTT